MIKWCEYHKFWKNKNYLKYHPDMLWENFDIPWAKEDGAHYYILNIEFINTKNKTTINYKKEDLQLVFFLITSMAETIWLLDSSFKKIKIADEEYNINTPSIKMLDYMITSQKETIEIEYDETELNYYIVSYPVFNEDDDANIITKSPQSLGSFLENKEKNN